jgi:hypothetical protein
MAVGILVAQIPFKFVLGEDRSRTKAALSQGLQLAGSIEAISTLPQERSRMEDYTDLQTTASFVNRIANIENMSVKAFGGSLAAKGSYDMRENIPRFGATTAVKGMDLTQLFRAMRPTAAQNIRGLINMDLDITGVPLARQSLAPPRSEHVQNISISIVWLVG